MANETRRFRERDAHARRDAEHPTQASPPATADPRFRRLLGAKLCVDIAEYALGYALLIAIVQRTGSGIHSTLLVAAFTLPAILFGIPAGAIADRLPKRPVLVAALIVRAALTVVLFRVIGDVWKTYGAILLFAAVGQVFGPVWVAVLPRLVGLERLSRAHALLNLAQLGGQVAGIVVLAPLFLKTLGDRSVFIVSGAFLLAAIVMTVRIGQIDAESVRDARPERTVRAVRSGLLAGWEAINGDAKVYLAVVQLTIVACLLKSLVVLFPFFTREVLGIAPENTVFVAAPAAIGAALGLALAPALAVLGRSRLATAGFVTLILSLSGLALVNVLRPFVAGPMHLGMTGIAHRAGIPPVVTTAMLFAIPMGLGISLTLVAARTVLNERTPEEVQARVFATQGAIANVVSLVPLFITGALTSLIGARPVMLLAAVASGILPIWLTRRRAMQETQAPASIGRAHVAPPGET
jgi:MFS family permease